MADSHAAVREALDVDPRSQTSDQARPSPLHTLVVTALVSALCTLLVLSPVAYTAFRHLPERLVTVDLQKLIEDDQQKSIATLAEAPNGVANESQRAAYLKNTSVFASRLGAALDLLGQECRCVVVNKAAVLSGAAPDYTAVIGQQLAKP